MKEITVRSAKHSELLDITGPVQQAVRDLGASEGVCTVFVPHTTAGITINENADRDVVSDLMYALDQAVPWKSPHYRHGEGNTAAHVKSGLLGHSVQVLVHGGQLQLGTWQGIFFCEFDGPRSRRVWVNVSR